MADGLVSPVDEGTPQGGPLSPLLSNLVLDDLDKELTRRGHRFCRYADDCNIYVRSRRAGERVMASVSRFLTTKLRLTVNEAKSAVERPEHRAKSPRQIQDADPGPDPPDTGDQPAAVDRGRHAIPHRMARLFRLLPDPPRAHEPGSVDPPKITLVSLAAVAERAQSLQRTAPSWRAKVPCSGASNSGPALQYHKAERSSFERSLVKRCVGDTPVTYGWQGTSDGVRRW